MSIGVLVSKRYKIDYTMQKRFVAALESRKKGKEDDALIREIEHEITQ